MASAGESELPPAERPWRVRRRVRIYEGLGRTIDLEEVETPEGHILSWPQIHVNPGSLVVPFIDDETIVMVRQYRHAIGQVTLELPAGGSDPGEEPEAAARRELHEEAALEADTLHHLGSFQCAVGVIDDLAHLYLAFGCRPVSEHHPGHEPTDTVRVPFQEALEMARSGAVDAHTAFPLLLAADWLARTGRSTPAAS